MVIVQIVPSKGVGRRTPVDVPLELIPDPEPLPDERIQSREEVEKILAAIHRLPPGSKALIVARCDGWRYRQIAAVQKKSVSTIAEAVERATGLLREELEKVGVYLDAKRSDTRKNARTHCTKS